jgi:hypothetical protein
MDPKDKLAAALLAALVHRRIADENLGNFQGQRAYQLFLSCITACEEQLAEIPDMKAVFDAAYAEALAEMLTQRDADKAEYLERLEDLPVEGLKEALHTRGVF